MLYVISKEDLSIKDVKQGIDYEINLNIDLTGKSTFILTESLNAEKGDFIVVKDINYKGIIENVETEKDKNISKINASEIDNIFDRKTILSNESLISSTGLEDFIQKTINNNFSNSADTLLNISYLKAHVYTHTKLNFKVDTQESGIYNLRTFLGNVKEKYNIHLEYEFTKDGFLYVNICKGELATLDIDATLEDIITYEEVYSVDTISKVTVLATETNQQFNYYLLTDRTISTDINNSNRAKGTIEIVTCESDVDAYQKAIDTFKSNSYKHNIELIITKDSKIFNENDFIIGRNLRIKTKNNGIYNTFISEINKKGNSNVYAVTCGNMRVTLLEKLRGVV